MTSDTELALERLVTLMDEQGVAGIDMWRQERKQADSELEQRAKQAALDSIHWIARVEMTKQRGAGDRVIDVARTVERYPVRYGDLEMFATKYRIPYEELMAVLRMERLEVRAKSGIWRNGSHSQVFIDRTAQQEARMKEAQKYEREAAEIAARHKEVASVPFAYPDAVVKDWKV